MPVPQVNSPSLKAVLEASGSNITKFTETLDQISQDIKSIERWLHDAGVRIVVEFEFDVENSPSDFPEEVLVTTESTWTALAWAPGPNGDAWRIQLRRYRREGSFVPGEMSSPQWGPDELLDSSPLIETPVADRVAVARADALARLVKEIASKIPQYDADVQVDGELHLFEYFEGPSWDRVPDGLGLLFAPVGTSVEGRPQKSYTETEAEELLADLRSLGSPEVESMITSGMWKGFIVRCTVSLRALRRLGLIS